MALWETYLTLLGVAVLGWLIGLGYNRLEDEARWKTAKQNLASAAARSQTLESAAKGVVAELDEARAKLDTLERENTRLLEESARGAERERTLSELREELTRTQEARAVAEDRAATANNAVSAAEAESDGLRRRLEDLSTEVVRHRSEAERSAAEASTIPALRDELALTQQRQATTAARVVALEAAGRDLDAELLRLRSQLATEEVENARLRSETECIPLLEAQLAELRAELAQAQQAGQANLARAEQVARLQDAFERAQLELAAAQAEKARLEDTAALVPELRETASQQRARLDELQAALSHVEHENARLSARFETLTANADDRRAMLEGLQTSLDQAFRALSAEALESNRRVFLDLAGTAFLQLERGVGEELDARDQTLENRLVPIHDKVTQLQGAVHQLELSRIDNGTALNDSLEALRSAQDALHLATSRLAQRVRGPSTVKRTEVISLRSLVETAGLGERCSFEERVLVPSEYGESRPGIVIHLPDGRTTVIDANAPLDAYLASLELEEGAVRRELLRAHAASMRKHVARLAALAHGSPPASGEAFVIMYVPMEDALAAALEEDPELIRDALGSSVAPAGPLTLLAHLKTAARTVVAAADWRQQQEG